MPGWLQQLFTQTSVAQSVIIYGLVIAAGIWLGRIRIAGITLGITWVLFCGLGLAYAGIQIDPGTEKFVKEFGLILFVYAIGLQVGPGFWASLKKNAITNNLLAAAIVGVGVLITFFLYHWLHTRPAEVTGVMSGAVTNTPGLASAQAALGDLHGSAEDKTMMTLAYAVTYPLGVFGIIAALLLLKALFRVNLDEERELHRRLGLLRANRPVTMNLDLENKQLVGQPLRRILEWAKEPIVVSRMYHQGEIITPTPDQLLAEGDVLLLVGPKQSLEQLKLLIGPPSERNLKTEKETDLVSRIIVVTRSAVTHKRLGDIPELHQQDFTLTRLSRAGIEMVPHGDMFLQLGDNVKVVGTEEGVQLVANALGNSLKRLEAPDLAPIFLGIVLGVILGSIPFYVPNIPIPVKIGLAGGPLLVALVLSRFGNVFYLNNYTTNSANLMIRELGISLFLASVGLGSGHQLGAAFSGGSGYTWLAMGAAITIVPLLIIGIIAHRYFRKTYFEICGLLAGASTDPPALAFATRLAGNDIPSVTYATVYPVTMILRIVAAQLLILML